MSTQKPIELILARNFLSSLTTPAFLVDDDGFLVFYNDAAGTLVGRRFEETGKLGPEQWGSEFGPFDTEGNPLPYDELPLTLALRQGRASHSRFRIRSSDGSDRDVEVSALPIVATTGARGAMVIFWPVEEQAPVQPVGEG